MQINLKNMITTLIMGAFLVWMIGEAAFPESKSDDKDPDDE